MFHVSSFRFQDKMKVDTYNEKGEVTGSIVLPKEIFQVPMNADLVHQVFISHTANQRQNSAHTKNRSEVRGGGRKPWRQKGTGRARHGSTRSPIWVGGGVSVGPRNEKNFERKVSKKMRIKALYTIMSQKLRDGEVLFVDSIKLSEPKTKKAVEALHSLSTVKSFEGLFSKKNNAAVIALSGKSKETERAFDNLGNIEVIEARNLNPLLLLQYKYLVIENPKLIYGKS